MEDYFFEMRKLIGHRPLMCTACGVIIENEKGEILLQERADNGNWGLPGGSMTIGEKFVETARREVFEETGLTVDSLSLFGIFSGKDRMIEYPTKDICCVTSIIFITKEYSGALVQQTDETKQNKFFKRECIPSNTNEFDKKYIENWLKGNTTIIVD